MTKTILTVFFLRHGVFIYGELVAGGRPAGLQRHYEDVVMQHWWLQQLSYAHLH